MFSERYWLPDGVGWSDLQRGDDRFLHAAPWLALTLLLLRTFVEGSVCALSATLLANTLATLLHLYIVALIVSE